MRRQYVHLSADGATALQVGRRKFAVPVILVAKTHQATSGGSRFWRGNDVVWLADRFAQAYLRRLSR